MKSKFVKGIFLICLMVLMSACNTKKEDVAAVVIDKEQIKKEIQAKEDLFAETYNAGVKKKIGYFADDAISFTQNRGPLVGKQAIVESLLDGLDSSETSNKIAFKTIEVFPSIDWVQVVEIGSYTVVDSTNTVVNSGNYMSLFEKRDGKYVSLREMSVSDMPLD